ncbi:NfeD family protein [Yinghuangia seranimata]|uniref:NfeD family protein n=1 Tax=Yinghuangia seranimata TaxID=408067 RepID=UPI00248B66AE|nr:NfeD family protein [Yinghuangia seranimata]MDI2126392.1 NfeD family protein [Yinghuangia seranimata]
MWWLVALGGLGIVGVLTSVVEFGMFAVGALAAAIAAGLGAGLIVQCIVFSAVSVSLLVFVRPIAIRQLQGGPRTRTGVEALTGKTALVLERVDENGGRIKLAGEVWSARAMDATQVFEPGEKVDVAEIDGATAVVI